jgi:predicted alpha/beta-hydrolase family hydrolase
LPFPGPLNVVSIVLFGAAVLLFWREKPHRLRVAFVAMMSVLVPLLIVYGTLDEVRNLSLVFPVAYLLACHTAARLYGIPLARPDYEPSAELRSTPRPRRDQTDSGADRPV